MGRELPSVSDVTGTSHNWNWYRKLQYVCYLGKVYIQKALQRD